MKRIIEYIIGVYKSVIYCFFPNLCISCGEIIDDGKFLCEECTKEITKINPLKRCLKCGNDKKYCVCKSRVYRFESLVSLYENGGKAKEIYYKYKFNKKQAYAPFFAKELSIAIREEYGNINFSGFCGVPTSGLSRFKRGFDHTALICEELSDMCDIPYYDNLLYCKRTARFQHGSNFEQRKINVRNKYGFKHKIKSGNYLLVDDIVTTGNTADAAALALLKAGADRVYVLSVLQTVLKKKD